jgi:hypothetical protein
MIGFICSTAELVDEEKEGEIERMLVAAGTRGHGTEGRHTGVSLLQEGCPPGRGNPGGECASAAARELLAGNDILGLVRLPGATGHANMNIVSADRRLTEGRVGLKGKAGAGEKQHGTKHSFHGSSL